MVNGLFIGARVKVVAVKHAMNSHLVGLEGVIIDKKEAEFGPIIYSLDTHPIRYEYREDGIHGFGLAAWQLEPILPEGAQPSELSFSELMDNLGVVVA